MSKAKPEPGFKVYRGGAYASPKEALTVTYRWYDVATKAQGVVGVRCAMDAPK